IHLESLVTAPFDREAVRRRREERRAQLLAELDAMAGITDYVSEGRRLGLRLAIASSSPSAYVRAHLGRGGSRCRAGRGARARRFAKWDRGGEGVSFLERTAGCRPARSSRFRSSFGGWASSLGRGVVSRHGDHYPGAG